MEQVLARGNKLNRWLAVGSFVLLVSIIGNSQTKLPAAAVQDLRGRSFDISKLSNGGRPIVLVFFTTSCPSCLSQLNRIADNYDDWTEETGVKLVAIALDDEKNVAKVEPYVKSKEWAFEVYLDTQLRLKNALNITDQPTTLILDGNLAIVWQHSGFQPGDDEMIFEHVRAIAGN
jgi:cytochrome c biogenesis protein CcmG/thiol:disulfide interchange protein DsbE